ncbi:MAG: hypothetical protein CVT65_06345 [Actinobacteria bacterium HGW-Actinobacteria-5]|jgi:hypothetical protein|nr:MAG: hypothetical protein CVT65_06345 [Actinobacteria bacterium HGW-Actinobacteria-5]
MTGNLARPWLRKLVAIAFPGMVIVNAQTNVPPINVLRADIAYGPVLVWAFVGILITHSTQTGLAGSHPAVIAATIACLAAFLAAEVAIIVRGRKRDVPA